MGIGLIFLYQKMKNRDLVENFWRKYVKWYTNQDLTNDMMFPLMRQAQIGGYLFLMMGIILISVGMFLLTL